MIARTSVPDSWLSDGRGRSGGDAVADASPTGGAKPMPAACCTPGMARSLRRPAAARSGRPRRRRCSARAASDTRAVRTPVVRKPGSTSSQAHQAARPAARPRPAGRSDSATSATTSACRARRARGPAAVAAAVAQAVGQRGGRGQGGHTPNSRLLTSATASVAASTGASMDVPPGAARRAVGGQGDEAAVEQPRQHQAAGRRRFRRAAGSRSAAGAPGAAPGAERGAHAISRSARAGRRAAGWRR